MSPTIKQTIIHFQKQFLVNKTESNNNEYTNKRKDNNTQTNLGDETRTKKRTKREQRRFNSLNSTHDARLTAELATCVIQIELSALITKH